MANSPLFQLTEKMSDDSVYRKILRLLGRGRDSPNNNNDLDSHAIFLFKEHLRVRLLEKKDKYLVRNGAYLFRELVKSTRGKNNPFRIFSLEELQKATNNFCADQILNGYSFGPTTYRGVIEDRHVAVKFSNIRDIVSLSLIKHRNVVKLMGCCLKTEIPIVVHELPNGTLEQNISNLSWTDRLRISTEIADALAYLHSELHITHGSLWDRQAILLDEFYSAKLGAFDFSEIQNQAESSDVETNIRNKLRKFDDISNFGVILLNLLGIETDDTSRFTKCKEKVEILKFVKLNLSEKEMPQIDAYIDLLVTCRDGEDELNMEEVVRELRRIRSMINHQPTTDGNESVNLSSGANASSSNNASTSYQEVTSDY